MLGKQLATQDPKYQTIDAGHQAFAIVQNLLNNMLYKRARFVWDYELESWLSDYVIIQAASKPAKSRVSPDKPILNFWCATFFGLKKDCIDTVEWLESKIDKLTE